MQLALIGLPGAGVKTLFSAITGLAESVGSFAASPGQSRVAVVKVADERLQQISRVYLPKKTTTAAVEIAEFPGLFGQRTDGRRVGVARNSDALVLALRSFPSETVPHFQGSVDPVRDLDTLITELVIADLSVVETRLRRLRISLKKRPNEEEKAEREVLDRCRQALDQGLVLRQLELSAVDQKRIRGFGFLTRKPLMLLLNIGDSQLGEEEKLTAPFRAQGYPTRALCADIEAELAQMESRDREEFMADLGIRQLAAPLVLGAAYQTLDLVTFYTYGPDECRAWTVHRGDTAVDAAAKIHTDIARGFIRAEVVGFEDFRQCGDIKTAKSRGRFRLEGKDYVVQDGDLIIIRHS
ncbi:MAG: DUF933 domain-containing protein [Acidobacteriota bacterium]